MQSHEIIYSRNKFNRHLPYNFFRFFSKMHNKHFDYIHYKCDQLLAVVE